MIRYHLRCEQGHGFESWFQSSSAYESQEKRKLVSCPACGSTNVERAIMAPRIGGKKKDRPEPAPLAGRHHHRSVHPDAHRASLTRVCCV